MVAVAPILTEVLELVPYALEIRLPPWLQISHLANRNRPLTVEARVEIDAALCSQAVDVAHS